MRECIFLRFIAPLLGDILRLPRRRKDKALCRRQFLELQLRLRVCALCGSRCLYSEGIAQARLGFLGLLRGRRMGR